MGEATPKTHQLLAFLLSIQLLFFYYRFNAESMLVLSSILHLGRSGLPAKAITEDDFERVALCLRILQQRGEKVKDFVCLEGRKALVEMLEAQSADGNLAGRVMLLCRNDARLVLLFYVVRLQSRKCLLS